jgi:TonB family protein
MKYLSSLIFVLMVLALGGFTQVASQSNRATKHYERNNLTFNYPDGWTLTDSNAEGQTVTLTREGSATQIVISMQDGRTAACDFEPARQKIASALTERVGMQIQAGAPPETVAVTTRIGISDVHGTELHGLIDHNSALADVYVFRMTRRFVSVAFVRADIDEPAKTAWDTVRTSLKVELLATVGSAAGPDAEISGGVLNGKAISLPKPDYPDEAKRARVSGSVTVQVHINELGNVISARAISGDPLLHSVCVAAARRARFSPTKLCGEPVRVTGVITYNFVAW